MLASASMHQVLSGRLGVHAVSFSAFAWLPITAPSEDIWVSSLGSEPMSLHGHPPRRALVSWCLSRWSTHRPRSPTACLHGPGPRVWRLCARGRGSEAGGSMPALLSFHPRPDARQMTPPSTLVTAATVTPFSVATATRRPHTTPSEET